jgi:hypothetical protein
MRPLKNAVRLLVLLICVLGVSIAPRTLPQAAAEHLLASESPPVIFTEPVYTTTRNTPAGSALPKSSRPFASFETRERQDLILPTIQLSAGQGNELSERERARKKAELSELLSASADNTQKIKNEQEMGLAIFGLIQDASKNKDLASANRGALENSNRNVPSEYESAVPEPAKENQFNSAYSEFITFMNEVAEKLQEHNRRNSELSLADAIKAAAADPTFTIAVGVDTAGGFFKIFINHAAKISDELIRVWECASKGQAADRSCTKPDGFKDYWSSWASGEDKQYTAGEMATDVLTLVGGPVVLNLGEKALIGALKKVPAGLAKAADAVRAGTERIRAGYNSCGFADESGRVLLKESEKMGTKLSGEATVATKSIDVLAMPKGQRPDPSTYLPKEYIENHIAEFDSGATRFINRGSLDRHGPAQTDGTMFVMPSREADRLIAEAKGNRSAFEKALGYGPGELNSHEIFRLDFPNPRAANIRMPSGNEAGVNPMWLPGGKLPTGVREAIIDHPQGAPLPTKPVQVILN